jgi:hypothetical protein
VAITVKQDVYVGAPRTQLECANRAMNAAMHKSFATNPVIVPDAARGIDSIESHNAPRKSHSA